MYQEKEIQIQNLKKQIIEKEILAHCTFQPNLITKNYSQNNKQSENICDA